MSGETSARLLDGGEEGVEGPGAKEGDCHGSTGSPSALSEEDSKGGVTVLEGSKVLARGTRSCT